MRKMQSLLMCVTILSIFIATTSCENLYDDEADCSTKIKFVFKKHRQALQAVYGKAANVFDSSVGSVHVFIYDAESGALVFERSETTGNLKTEAELNIGTGTERCYMTVNLDKGKYRIIAWCGLDENDNNNAFFLRKGDTRAGYSECVVKLSEQSGNPVNNEKYDGVYHGAVEMAVVDSYGSTVIPVELTKNTNDISVFVQHTSTTFSQGDYEVVYTDANGTMKFEDNMIMRDDVLEYHPYATSFLTSSTEYNGSLVEAGALVSHISTARLMESNKKDARLEVRDKDGNTVFSIPFIQYVLEMQTFTSDSQYYLDCEDTYNCSFYLTGDNGLWAPAMIIINNWVKVPDQTGSIGGE